MTKAERLELIRAVIRKVRGFEPNPVKPKKPRNPLCRQFPPNPKGMYVRGPQILYPRYGWIISPEGFEPDLTPRTKRTAKPSPLILLAKRYPVRKPRREPVGP